MTARNLLLAGLAAGALVPLAPATAQTRPPGPPLTYGAPIAGLCTFSRDQILATSKVGQSVIARLKQLDAAWHAELQPQIDAINADKQRLQAQAATLDRATLDAQDANWQLRASNLQKLVDQRQREMQATEQKQVAVVLQQADPILQTLFQGKQCSVLIERGQGGVAVVNPQMDLSAAAVTELDAKIQTLTFDREHLDTQPGAPGPQGQ